MRPFFVVGAVRSGTTLLRLMLGHHSKICRCEEMEFITGDLVGPEVTTDTTEYVRKLKLNRGFRLSGYKILEDASFPEIARDFLRQRLSADQKPIVGATVHHNFDELPALWSDARFIYINRDPRDVARSCVQMGWAGTAWTGAKFWLDANDAWLQLRTQIPDRACMELTFEELTSNPKETLTRVCKFLEVDYGATMLDIDQDTTYAPPDPGSARSWRSSATADEIAQVETRIGRNRLEQAGYTISNHSPIPNTFYQRSRISLQDVLARVRVRVKRYGLSLWLQGALSRRLPFRNMRERIQLKIDQVDNLHMK